MESFSHSEKDEQEDEEESADGDAVHGFPVERVDAVAGGDVGQLYAAEYKGEQKRKENGKIAFGRDAQLNVVPADKCSGDFEETADKRKQYDKRKEF